MPKPDFTIDLSELEGGGDFVCPRCRMHISPDDITEKAYNVVGTELNIKGDELKALAVKCLGCDAVIKFEGFEQS